MRWTSNYEHQQFKAQERRDFLRAEAEQPNHTQKEPDMKRTTSQGDRVEKFPDVAPIRLRIGDLRERLTALFDQAVAAQETQRRMDGSARSDLARFPSVGGGQA